MLSKQRKQPWHWHPLISPILLPKHAVQLQGTPGDSCCPNWAWAKPRRVSWHSHEACTRAIGSIGWSYFWSIYHSYPRVLSERGPYVFLTLAGGSWHGTLRANFAGCALCPSNACVWETVAQSKNTQHNEKLHLYLLATSAEQLLEILAHPSATPSNAAKAGAFQTAYTWLMHSQLPPHPQVQPA